ncbi:MAG: twin-arginine translocase TatA/TatE family subunit [Thermodesulfobacteriota bacterium]|nr:twin-arginine translocase TatA/TatE family subunit [Thermodesulfobacteriota bacterium]
MPHFGPMEIGIILVIILIIFGAGKLPQVFGAMGKGLRQFRKGQAGEYDDEDKQEKPQNDQATMKSSDKKEEKN